MWIGRKLKKTEIAELKKKIQADPGAYISQRYMALSRVNDNIVDLRLLTQILPDEIIVSNVPWGRGLPADGNGKVNLSGNGREFAVLVPKECRKALLPAK